MLLLCSLLSTLSPYTTLFRSFCMWATELSSSGVFVGAVGLLVVNFRAHFTPAVEIGWRLARERSEEHTSELQSRFDLVCRLVLEKTKHANDLKLESIKEYIII